MIEEFWKIGLIKSLVQWKTQNWKLDEKYDLSLMPHATPRKPTPDEIFYFLRNNPQYVAPDELYFRFVLSSVRIPQVYDCLKNGTDAATLLELEKEARNWSKQRARWILRIRAPCLISLSRAPWTIPSRNEENEENSLGFKTAKIP